LSVLGLSLLPNGANINRCKINRIKNLSNGATTFTKRLNQNIKELETLYSSLYDKKSFEKLLALLKKRNKERKEYLIELDNQRVKDPTWYQKEVMVGMMLYTEHFSSNFKNMVEHLDYLNQLGISLIHVMPPYKMPKLLNDGGYAVSSFINIDERFGSDEDFDNFTKSCHDLNISVCADFVLNHTSDEHQWALKAKEGDPHYKEYYYIFKDRKVVEEYEKHAHEVFPVLAPGNFSFNAQMESWVLTTFNHYQWDLNYKNYNLFLEMVDALLIMANRGVDVFRFDAIPYIWKEWGTNSRNLPEVFTIVRLLRLALEVSCPATIIMGEVVMAPKEVFPYFGTEDKPLCHLLYNVTGMVELWNALATRDTRMLAYQIDSLPSDSPTSSSWINYVRCHDDIGWGFNEHVAASLGFDPFLHKRFLISFYLGSFENSFSRGQLYEADPKTLDARICGTCASLCGLEKAIAERDEYQVELAIKRIVLLHAFSFVTNGIPMLYSGDEIGMLNNYSYIHDVHKGRDSRNLHRQDFDWISAAKIDDLSLNSSIIFNKLKRLITIKKGDALLGSANNLSSLNTSDISVISLLSQPKKPLDNQVIVIIANFSEYQKKITIDSDDLQHLLQQNFSDLVQGKEVRLVGEEILVGPYEILILKSHQ